MVKEIINRTGVNQFYRMKGLQDLLPQSSGTDYAQIIEETIEKTLAGEKCLIELKEVLSERGIDFTAQCLNDVYLVLEVVSSLKYKHRKDRPLINQPKVERAGLFSKTTRVRWSATLPPVDVRGLDHLLQKRYEHVFRNDSGKITLDSARVKGYAYFTSQGEECARYPFESVVFFQDSLPILIDFTTGATANGNFFRYYYDSLNHSNKYLAERLQGIASVTRGLSDLSYRDQKIKIRITLGESPKLDLEQVFHGSGLERSIKRHMRPNFIARSSFGYDNIAGSFLRTHPPTNDWKLEKFYNKQDREELLSREEFIELQDLIFELFN